MLISIVIPAYNEEDVILHTINQIRSYFMVYTAQYEILVVNDRSTDKTAQLARDAGCEVIELSRHMGKGGAVRQGMLAARGDMVLFTDADLPYSTDLIGQAAEKLASGTDVVIGSRYDSNYKGYGLVRRVSSFVFSKFVNAFLHLGIADTQCGFKTFSRYACREIFTRSQVEGFCFDAEALFLAKELGFTIDFVHAVMQPLTHGSSINLLADSLDMTLSLFTIRKNAKRGMYHIEGNSQKL